MCSSPGTGSASCFEFPLLGNGYSRARSVRPTIRLRLSCVVGRQRLVRGSVLNSKFQTAPEGKAEGNLFSAASELFKFLASRERTQFPISESNRLDLPRNRLAAISQAVFKRVIYCTS